MKNCPYFFISFDVVKLSWKSNFILKLLKHQGDKQMINDLFERWFELFVFAYSKYFQMQLRYNFGLDETVNQI